MSFRISSERMRWTSSPGRQVGIDRRALEVLVPVGGVVHEPALHVLLPERRAAIDAQAVEAEAVDADLRRELERRPQVLFGLVGDADDEEAVDDLDAGGLGVADRRSRSLRASAPSSGGRGSSGCRSRCRTSPCGSPTSPASGTGAARPSRRGPRSPYLMRILRRDQAVADRLDALGLEQEVVVDEVDRAVAVLLQLLRTPR